MIYLVKQDGQEINRIEVDEAQVDAFAQATGWQLIPAEQAEGGV